MCDGENPAKEKGLLSSNDADDVIGNRWIERGLFDDYDISQDIGLGSFAPSDSDDDIIGNRWIERRSFDDYDISQDIGLGPRSFVPSDEEDEHVEVVYDETANLFPNSKADDMGFTVGPYIHVHEDMGCVIGGIKFVDRHLNETGCTQYTVANIPLDVDGITVTNISAKFILLVEKIDLAKRLRASQCYSKFPCVIVATMGRSPSYSTRKFLYMLNKGGNDIKLQLFVLLDCSPCSIKTMLDLIHYDYKLDINWLGIQPCHVRELMKARVLGELMIHKNCNKKECSDLLELSFQRQHHHSFRGQLRLMLGKVPYKVPVEVFSYNYLMDCYLPSKLMQYSLRVPVAN